MHGLSAVDYQTIKTKLAEVLATDVAVWVFGSRARGDNQRFSDLDLMLEADKDMSADIRVLDDCFEESSLDIKVDIVQEKDFADSYFDSYMLDRKRF